MYAFPVKKELNPHSLFKLLPAVKRVMYLDIFADGLEHNCA